MGKKLVMIGGGGHCKSVLDAALKMREYSEIVITDPDLPCGSLLCGCSVAGDDSMLPTLRENGFEYAFITVGSIKDASLRIKLSRMAEESGFLFSTIIDPSAAVSDFSSIGVGTFIGKNAIVNADAAIGKHCIINSGSIIEHGCTVGDYTHVSVGAILCGDAHVGRESFIGAGTTVIQGIHIGDRTVIGANSTVLADVGDNLKASKYITDNRRQ